MYKWNEICLIIVAVLAVMWLQTANADETVKVMVIDTGVSLSIPNVKKHVKEKDNFDYRDNHGHGTAMSDLILRGTCKQIELISCRYFDALNVAQLKKSNACFKRALKEHVQYINYSSYGTEASQEEYKILKQLDDKNVVITVAAGNDGKNLTPTLPCSGAYPACYGLKNTYVVQNLEKDETLHKTSNHLKSSNVRSEVGVDVFVAQPDNQWASMTGTSPASAIFMNKILLKRCQELNK